MTTPQRQKLAALNDRIRDLSPNDKVAFISHLTGGFMGITNDESVSEKTRDEIVRTFENALKFAEM